MNYKTKIMATMGPTLVEVEQLVKAIKMEVSYFRLHLGSRERDVCQYIQNVEEAKKISREKVSILLDLPSSRPRVAELPYQELVVGSEYLVTSDIMPQNDNSIPIPGIDKLLSYLKIGERLLFRDGKIVLEILKIDTYNRNLTAICRTCNTRIGRGCSCVMPDSDVSYDSIVEDDINVFEQMKKRGQFPDYICISFASSVEQVNKVKEIISHYWPRDKVRFIVKVENRFGVNRYKELLGVSDGIMIGRGDLALHIDPTLVPIIQEKICKYSNEHKKECIIGTEFFENFATTGVISRPELTDVACAIKQNASAIMLSMESANSKYPFETLEMVSSIIWNINKYSNSDVVIEK